MQQIRIVTTFIAISAGLEHQSEWSVGMFKVPTLNKNKNTRYFNSASQIALQCMLSDWAHVQRSSARIGRQEETSRISVWPTQISV